MLGERQLTVYGSSDDLIEVDGGALVSEEFYASKLADEEGDMIAFSFGTVLRVRYSREGIWRITVEERGDAVAVESFPAGDATNPALGVPDYSDRVTLIVPPKRGRIWAAHATGLARGDVR